MEAVGYSPPIFMNTMAALFTKLLTLLITLTTLIQEGCYFCQTGKFFLLHKPMKCMHIVTMVVLMQDGDLILYHALPMCGLFIAILYRAHSSMVYHRQ